MKTVTLEQVKAFEPCWLEYEDGRARLEEIGRRKERWSALNVLALEEVSIDDRLWLVLREELIDAKILHEFACRCAERALSTLDNPDPRSVAAIAAKRAWLRGEITDEELHEAQDAARDAAWDAAWYAAWDGAWAVAQGSAQVATWAATWAEAWFAARAAAAAAVGDAAWSAERQKQLEILVEMLEVGE